MRKLLATSIIAAALAPAVARAAVWVDVATGQGVKVRIDFLSIYELKNGERKAWVEYTYDQPQTTYLSAEGYTRVVILNRYRCEERTEALLQQVLYNAQGKGISSTANRQDQLSFQDVVPDSLAQSALTYVCTSPAKKIPSR